MNTAFALLTGVVLLSACDAPSATGPGDIPVEAPEAIGDLPISSGLWFQGYSLVAPIRVYQQNVYVGTDVDAVIAAGATSSDPAVLFGALLGALNTFDGTDWNARAGRMADEIRRQGPDVISLNEISTVSRRGLGGYGVGTTAPTSCRSSLVHCRRAGSTIGLSGR